MDISGLQWMAVHGQKQPHALHRPLASQGCTGPFAVGHLNDSLIRHVQLAGSRLERGHLRLQFLNLEWPAKWQIRGLCLAPIEFVVARIAGQH